MSRLSFAIWGFFEKLVEAHPARAAGVLGGVVGLGMAGALLANHRSVSHSIVGGAEFGLIIFIGFWIGFALVGPWLVKHLSGHETPLTPEQVDHASELTYAATQTGNEPHIPH